MQAIGAAEALPDGYVLGPVSTVALRGTTHAVQLYQQPPTVNAGSFGASKLFYIELDQCISLFKEAFPPENMLRRKLLQVGHKDKVDYDAKVLQAKHPYLKDLGRSLILRMETPQRADFVSLVRLA